MGQWVHGDYPSLDRGQKKIYGTVSRTAEGFPGEAGRAWAVDRPAATVSYG
jgi:hypothetical protein